MSDAVQQIKERLSILDVVAPYVELHKAGKHHKGKSPFTQEKTPSFFVSPERGMYYCFSTSQGGDIFTFIQAMEGVDFKGALKILAEKAGVELVPEDPKKRTERDQQYALLETATKFFESWLPKIDDATAYLKRRGVTGRTIGAWRIGYAPGPPAHGWRELREHLAAKGFTDAQMLTAGVIKSAGEGKAPYDVFRDRITFPVCDPSGRVVGYSGRILATDSDAPKYVNSPETELFNKSEILFGYDKAKQGIRKFDFSLIVEGQFDVVLAHQAGYTNAVAVSGTSLTAHHVSLLGRLSNRVVLALDADRAGVAAVKRAADLMLARGMDVKVARLPNGEDPADIVANDPKQFKDVIGHATHVIEFLLSVVKEEAKDDRTFKLRARDEVVPYLTRIESSIDREHFTGVIADALEVTPEAIRLEVARLARTAEEKIIAADATPAREAAEPAPARASRQEALTHYCAAVVDLLEAKVRAAFERTFADITGEALEVVRERIPASAVSPLQFRLESEYAELRTDRLHEELAAKLSDLNELLLRAAIREKRAELTTAEQAGNEEVVTTLTNDISELQRKLSNATVGREIFTE